MHSIYFQKFANQLDIIEPNYKIPTNEPVHLIFEQNANLSKHEMLRRFKKLLFENKIYFIRPLNNLTSEWIIDLKDLKNSLNSLNNINYLKGKITVEPEIIYNQEINDITEEIIRENTFLKFSIYENDIKINTMISNNNDSLPEEIKKATERFYKDFDKNQICGFLMMKYEDSRIHNEIVELIRAEFENYNIKILRADDKWYSDDLFSNIKTYMHCCSFGIGLFERVKTEYFNPNVSLEIGYMMALNKSILLLKDSTLNSLHTDLVSKLYYTFDYQNPNQNLKFSIERWLKDKELI